MVKIGVLYKVRVMKVKGHFDKLDKKVINLHDTIIGIY